MTSSVAWGLIKLAVPICTAFAPTIRNSRASSAVTYFLALRSRVRRSQGVVRSKQLSQAKQAAQPPAPPEQLLHPSTKIASNLLRSRALGRAVPSYPSPYSTQACTLRLSIQRNRLECQTPNSNRRSRSASPRIVGETPTRARRPNAKFKSSPLLPAVRRVCARSRRAPPS